VLREIVMRKKGHLLELFLYQDELVTGGRTEKEESKGHKISDCECVGAKTLVKKHS
jgi:hypothetical protein